MSQRGGYGIGTGRKSGVGAASGFAPLIDILMASIGIYIVIFAFQEIEDHPTLHKARYDGIVLCQSPSAAEIYLAPDAAGESIAYQALEGYLASETPEGGRFLFAKGDGCYDAGEGIRTPSYRLRLVEEALTDNSKPNRMHQFEIAPLGNPPYDRDGILARWKQEVAE
jgi:hypothetical protein